MEPNNEHAPKTVALKPCPFCGKGDDAFPISRYVLSESFMLMMVTVDDSTPIFDRLTNYGRTYWSFDHYCTPGTGRSNISINCPTAEACIAAWNTRAEPGAKGK